MTTIRLPDSGAREAVVSKLDMCMLVEAGAGSGKTTLIVKRMLALIERGVHVEKIAAVTFTRKAASELRERFETKLEEYSANNALCMEALRNRDRIFIGTIHAFCARVLREHSIEAGISPAFEELDEVQESIHRERFWKAFAVRAKLDGSPLLSNLHNAGITVRQLEDSFAGFHSYRDACFNTPEFPAPSYKSVISGLTKLHASCERVSEIAGGAKFGMLTQLSAVVREFANAQDVSGAVVARLLRRLPRGEPNSAFIPITLLGRKNSEKEPLQLIKAEYMSVISQDVEPWERLWSAHSYPAVVAYLRAASNAFAAECKRLSKLTFDDLILEVARLLREQPTLRRTVGNRWTHLLIDEFQDTDPAQAEIALLLSSPFTTEDWRQVVPRDGRLFLVGDPKQSIYRFRRADIATYEFVRSRIEAGGEVHQLTSNFRSTDAVARVVNEHFSKVFPASVEAQGAAVIQAAFAPMQPVGEIAQRFAGKVSRYLVDIPKSKMSDVVNTDARLVASLVAGRVARNEQRPEDFLIITSQRVALHVYARELGYYGIPVAIDGARYETDDLINELTTILCAIANPCSALHVAAALEGIMCGASHEELLQFRGKLSITEAPEDSISTVGAALYALHKWWKCSQQLPTASLIDTVIDDIALLPLIAGEELGENRAGVLLQFISKLREQQDSATSISTALELLNSMMSAENTASPIRPSLSGAVRVMNLHRAKGLEARTVILAAPIADSVRNASMIVLRGDDHSSQGWLKVMDKKATVAAPEQWENLEISDKERDRAEKARLLYVATTRAKEELIVSQLVDSTTTNGAAESVSAWGALSEAIAHLPILDIQATAAAHREQIAHTELLNANLRELENRHSAFSTSEFHITSVTAATAHSEDADSTNTLEFSPSGSWDSGNSGSNALQMGNALHAVVEAALRGRRGSDLEEYIDAIAWSTWGREGSIEKNRGELAALLEQAMSSDAWKLIAEGTTLPETPLSMLMPNSTGEPMQLIEGRLDALNVQNNKATVVDWKTTSSTTLFQSLLKQYEAQSETYAKIVAHRAGLEVDTLVQPVSYK